MGDDYELQQIAARRPGGEIAEALGAQPAVQWLVRYCAGAKSTRSAAVDALRAWRDLFAAEQDRASLLALDGAARSLGIDALRISERFPLLCDPLGDSTMLSPRWQQRIDVLRRAVAGEHRLHPRAVGLFEDDEPSDPEFGPPDPARLYEKALRFEQATGRPFPRELAAVWSIANGIAFDDDPFLAPVSDWEQVDDGHEEPEVAGLRIGCGHYCQGALVLTDSKDAPCGGPIIDVDDDWVESARYEDLGVLLDKLLGLEE